MLDTSNSSVATALARVLADTHILYMKTHKFHWNVEGPNFRSLHLMFEEQYTDLFAAIDELAERLRALGEYAPGTSSEFADLATIKETEGKLSADAMLRELISDNEAVVKSLKEGITAAEDAGDPSTADLLTARATVHDKAAWMMRSTLG